MKEKSICQRISYLLTQTMDEYDQAADDIQHASRSESGRTRAMLWVLEEILESARVAYECFSSGEHSKAIKYVEAAERKYNQLPARVTERMIEEGRDASTFGVAYVASSPGTIAG